ncbi:hypothetical protein KFE94_00620 [bacterium SCSIO 12643]|nr:hypothetical protein KFE94_00620 [bacterium SCSIO 12643]
MENSIEDILGGRFSKEKFITHIQSNPAEFHKTLEISISNLKPQAWRAAWVINHCMSKDDERIRSFIEKYIQHLDRVEDGHQRELLKVLSKMKIDEDQEGYLFDKCATIWEDVSKSPSVRIIAFRFMVQVAENYPELKNEMGFFCQDHYIDELSPGIKNSLKKLIKSAKINQNING